MPETDLSANDTKRIPSPEIVKHGLGSLMSEMVDLVNLTGSRLSQETTLVTAVGECLDWVNCEKTNTVGGTILWVGL